MYRDSQPVKNVVARMQGVVVFSSVAEALEAGYQIYGKTDDGYLARLRTAKGWALALIVIAPH